MMVYDIWCHPTRSGDHFVVATRGTREAAIEVATRCKRIMGPFAIYRIVPRRKGRVRIQGRG